MGRPRSFDREAALEQAMLVFWEFGYEGASLSLLTEAMGITPPSLYAAFGDKKTLFLEAVDRYLADSFTAVPIIREAPTAQEAVSRLLHAAATGDTQRGKPRGCMLIASAMNCSAEGAEVKAALASIRSRIEAELRARIQADIDRGFLPEYTSASALASLYMAVTQGMSVQASDGASRTRLLAMADAAMQLWPSISIITSSVWPRHVVT
ncbi:MAG TPA: TetR/AcrR family transcriptional regulator [Gemmatimonadales bacterium]|nr:TetR/AcrR family transcriptional regulator [Gemmatimonadales bacterium]